MARTIVSYSIMAVVAVVALRIVFGLFGLVFSMLASLFWLAAIGFLIYLVLKIISPDTASRIKEAIRGKEKAG
jgi:hypothetical protein